MNMLNREEFDCEQDSIWPETNGAQRPSVCVGRIHLDRVICPETAGQRRRRMLCLALFSLGTVVLMIAGLVHFLHHYGMLRF